MSLGIDDIRKGRRFGLARKGELGGVDGNPLYEEVLAKPCESCGALILERKTGFAICRCGAIVHSMPPCSTLVNGRIVCGRCVMRIYPLGPDYFIELVALIVKPRKVSVEKALGLEKGQVKKMDDQLEVLGLVKKHKPTRLGWKVYWTLWQLYAHDADVVMVLDNIGVDVYV